MQRIEDSEKGMSWVKNNFEEYVYNSLGVAYKLDDDELYAVKVPVVDGEAKGSEAVMIDISDENHPEYPDMFVIPEAVDDVVEWYEEVS